MKTPSKKTEKPGPASKKPKRSPKIKIDNISEGDQTQVSVRLPQLKNSPVAGKKSDASKRSPDSTKSRTRAQSDS